MLLSENNVITLVSNIAPYYEIRDFIRKKLKYYYQIYVKADVARCKKNDIKKIYEHNKQNIIGLDDVYEEPRNPDLIINTDNESIEESYNKIIHFLKNRGLV